MKKSSSLFWFQTKYTGCDFNNVRDDILWSPLRPSEAIPSRVF